MIGVFQILSLMMALLACALIAPAAIAVVGGEEVADDYLVVAVLTGFVAVATLLAVQGRSQGLTRMGWFVLVVAGWTVLPAIAAVPIMLSTGVDYVAALFEATSGLTTSGGTVFASLADAGPATVFWRAELQWLGGLATLITFAIILAPAGLGGLSNRGLAMISGFGEAGPGRAGHAVREIGVVYAIVTAACIGLLLVGGLPVFDAVCIAFSTVSTGGFVPVDGGMAAYQSPAVALIVPLFMLIGATSIVWQRMVFERRGALAVEHRETFWVAGAALAAGIVYAVAFAAGGGILPALGEGIFTGISIVSTTGFETRPGGLAALPGPLVLGLALGGGAALSTAGGIKYHRIGAMLTQSGHELKRMVFPHSVRGKRFGGHPYDLGLIKAIWANLALSLAVVIASALALSLSLPGFDAALVAAVAAFANIGPLYTPDWPDAAGWPSYAAFDGVAKLVTIVTMIAGRIEVVVLFAAVNVAYWRS